MDDLKEGINFRAYGQKDPLVEYKMDGFTLFENMLYSITSDVVSFIFKFTIATQEDTEQVKSAPRRINTATMRAQHSSGEGMGYQGNLEPQENEASRAGKKTPVKVGEKIGRNELCPCGSGKKYKNCHGKNA